MLQPNERAWWWKVAMHLDEAQLSMRNVLAHNVDDPTPVHLLMDKLLGAQAFLLEIFRWKGLLPGVPIAGAHVAAPVVPSTSVAEDGYPLVEGPVVQEVTSVAVDASPEVRASVAVEASQEALASAVVDVAQSSSRDLAEEINKSNIRAVDELLHREGLDR